MQNSQEEIKKLETLKDLEKCYIGMFEEGGGEVCKINDIFILFQIPMYGGEPIFVGGYKNPEQIINIVSSWT